MGPGTRTWRLVVLTGFVASLVAVPVASAKVIVGNNKANKLMGTAAGDEIYGRYGADVIVGLGGPDRLYGQQGADILLGEKGSDRLWGLGRDDTLEGGPGGDRIWSGYGSDVVEAGPGNDVVQAGEPDARMDSIDCGFGFDRAVVNRRDQVFNCEQVTRLRGPSVRGRLWRGGDGDDDWIASGHVYDLIIGLHGNDSLNGFAYPDILWGNEGYDHLFGNSGPDVLLGGADDDLLFGEGGRDRLWGGLGVDRLYGGEDDDLLISVGHDRLVDLVNCGAGRDRAVARPNDEVVNCERVIRIER